MITDVIVGHDAMCYSEQNLFWERPGTSQTSQIVILQAFTMLRISILPSYFAFLQDSLQYLEEKGYIIRIIFKINLFKYKAD